MFEKDEDDPIAALESMAADVAKKDQKKSKDKKRKKTGIGRKISKFLLKTAAITAVGWGSINYYAPGLELEDRASDIAEQSANTIMSQESVKSIVEGMSSLVSDEDTDVADNADFTKKWYDAEPMTMLESYAAGADREGFKEDSILSNRFSEKAFKGLVSGALGLGPVDYFISELFLNDEKANEEGITGIVNGLFGAEAEVENNSFAQVSDRWYAALGRYKTFMDGSSDNRDFMKEWYKKLDHLKGGTFAEKAAGVDAVIDSAIQYKSDKGNYGLTDYWASPVETALLGKGDNEDMAILKYFSLRELGIPADRLYAVSVGLDGAQLNHVSLIVDVEDHGMFNAVLNHMSIKDRERKFVVFDDDNKKSGQRVEENKRDYKAYYAMNENGIWAVSDDNEFWGRRHHKNLGATP